MFIDSTVLYVKAGDGGKGCISFRREKYVPKGGPNGGNGGNGGNVVIECDSQLFTLFDVHYHKNYLADSGKHGLGSKKHGKSGKDLIIKVPCGITITDTKANKILGDLTKPNEKIIVACGGRGGRGNSYFATSQNRAPRIAEDGTQGEEKNISLSLKILSDIGLVGEPNAGKSTLISVISNAKPKIANYPFTTLTPNIGIVPYENYQFLSVADIPGLVQGASKGKGIGLQFLKHIERTHLLLFVLPANSPSLEDSYNLLYNELETYNPSLIKKKRAVCITKIDIADPSLSIPSFGGIPIFLTSSVTGQGISTLKKTLLSIMKKKK